MKRGLALLTAASTMIVATGLGIFEAANASDISEECAQPEATFETSDVPEGTDVVACGLVGEVLVSPEGVGVTIPDPGETVGAHISNEDSFDEGFKVTTQTDGDIDYDVTSAPSDPTDETVVEEPDINPDSRTAPPPSAGCNDSTYKLRTAKRGTAFVWSLGDGARPAGLTTGETATILRAGANTIVNGSNPCGLGDGISATYSYAGETSYETDMKVVDGKTVCGTRDQVSTIDFGDLAKNGSPPVGLNCTWWNAQDQVLESDIRLNTVDYKWTTTPLSSSCSGQYDLQSVATHELGHAFDLLDVYDSSDRYLTMYGYSYKCKRLARSLGRGDVLGLQARF